MYKKRIFYILLVLCGLSMTARAQEVEWRDSVPTRSDIRKAEAEVRQARRDVRQAKQEVRMMKEEVRKSRHVVKWHNEFRIGWGDQLFESLMWHNPTNIITTMPATWQKTYHENYRHNQHIWAEYQWRFNYWFSLGGMIDVSEVGWDDVVRNGTGAEISRTNNQYFYNAVIMPTIRFTYYHHPYVNLYSGLGVGIDINGGTEKNVKGQNTEVGYAINLTVIGVRASYNRFFCALDLGGMYALRGANYIYMASSRIMNFSLGVWF